MVFSFLFVLSLGVSLALQGSKAFYFESRSYFARMNALSEARTIFEENQFREFVKLSKKGPPSSAAQKNSPPKVASSQIKKRGEDERKIEAKRRKMRRSCQYSTFNLAFLIKHPHDFYKKGAQKLFVSLYSHAPLSSEWEAIEIFESLLHNGRTQGVISFEALLEKDSPYRQSLYKILKGTAHYDLEKGEGYPPLEDFFCFNQKDKTAFRLHFASLPLLDALFGPQIRKELLQMEIDKWEGRQRRPYPTKEEFEELVQKEADLKWVPSTSKEWINFGATPPQRISQKIVPDKRAKVSLKHDFVDEEEES